MPEITKVSTFSGQEAFGDGHQKKKYWEKKKKKGSEIQGSESTEAFPGCTQ